MTQPATARHDHLAAWSALLETRVRELVAVRRGTDPNPDDPFRGLYLPDDAVDRILGERPPAPPGPDPRTRQVEHAQDVDEQAGAPSRLRRLTRDAGLTPLDLWILVAALAPDVDARLERLYGYLNDDVSRRRASIGLALELAGLAAAEPEGRERCSPGSPLVDLRLVLVEEQERPFLTRSLRVPDRVTAHLLGSDRPAAALLGLLDRPAGHPGPEAAALAGALVSGAALVHLRDRGRRSARSTAVAAVEAAGRPALALDLTRLPVGADAQELAAVAAREALLTGAALVVGPAEELARHSPPALARLAGAPVPVLLVGDTGWDPAWSPRVPLQLDAPELGPGQREQVWRQRMTELAGPVAATAPVPAHLQLGPEQIGRAVEAAHLAGSLSGAPIGEGLDLAALQRGAREQNASGLERLARRFEPAVGWDDLVLPAAVHQQLHEVAARARHRDRVLGDWRMRPGGGRGRGVTALFAGDSGTGKTMAAEVIAADLGLDLYTVDLATVVDKYVGETEKNLERIFSEAAGVNAVLLFDEADAVFGKRSEVRDAHDRYANVESAYLLQRMESFDGLAVLATNLRANIDEAFTRRLDAIVDFPTPDAGSRRALWERCLGRALPRGDDLDLDFCATAFELTGGTIRSAAVTAAYLAAERGGPVGMAELIAAVRREYRKLGRLLLEREFGPYLDLAR